MRRPKITRRGFMRGSAAAAGLGALGLPRPVGADTGLTPLSTYKILEIFLHGGLSPWETLWFHPQYAGLTQPGLGGIDWADLCGPGASYVPDGSFFDMDHQNPSGPSLALQLGPSWTPLDGTDLAKQTRVIAVQHKLPPHEAAQPYSLTGTKIGQPTQAGLGAAVNRFRIENGEPTSLSVVLHANKATQSGYATRVGRHGSTYRPLSISVGAQQYIDSAVDRTAFADADALRQIYANQYQERLVNGIQDRAPHHDAYRSSLDYLTSNALSSVFEDVALALPGGMTASHAQCDTVLSVVAAAQLLSKPSSPVHYACVIDSGLKRIYDTHDFNVGPSLPHAEVQCGNLWSALYGLRRAIDDGDLDPAQTLVFIHTDFGRKLKGNVDGTDHHTAGYVNVVMGGPIPIGTKPVAIGDITANGTAGGHFTTTDVRAAVAHVAGIDPLHPDMYDLTRDGGSVVNTTDPITALETYILGI